MNEDSIIDFINFLENMFKNIKKYNKSNQNSYWKDRYKLLVLQ